LQDIVDTDGYVALRKIEEDVLLGLSIQNHVIATGGSSVYSDQAMIYLKSDGILIFLDADLATLESRVRDLSTRGIAKQPDQRFAELFDERFTLYTRYADIVIKCDGMTQEQVCERIIEEVREKS
jgi:shikimate kinase